MHDNTTEEIQIGKIYKRKTVTRASPYPAYLIPTAVNELMTTTMMTRYYYDDVEKVRSCGTFECITEATLKELYDLVEG